MTKEYYNTDDDIRKFHWGKTRETKEWEEIMDLEIILKDAVDEIIKRKHRYKGT